MQSHLKLILDGEVNGEVDLVKMMKLMAKFTYVQIKELELTNTEETWGKVTAPQRVHKS